MVSKVLASFACGRAKCCFAFKTDLGLPPQEKPPTPRQSSVAQRQKQAATSVVCLRSEQRLAAAWLLSLHIPLVTLLITQHADNPESRLWYERCCQELRAQNRGLQFKPRWSAVPSQLHPACPPSSAGTSHPFTYLQKRSFPVPPLHPTAHPGIIPIEKLSA